MSDPITRERVPRSIWPLRVMISATKRGLVEEILFWWAEVFCDRRPFEPLVFPIILVAIHPLVHMIISFTNILFSTLTCHKVNNIGRLTTSVAPKLDGCPRRSLRDLGGGYHFAGFASCFAARSYLPKCSSSRMSGLSLARTKRSHRLLGLL